MPKRFPFRSRFEISAALATGATVILSFLGNAWWIIPLALFGLLCLVAPFTQRLEFFLPIIRHGDRSRPEVAITFDDGPDPRTTPLLLKFLERYKVRAAFFVIGQKAAEHPDLIQGILDAGHEIGNHSDSHDVFLMLRGRETIEREIRNCQERLGPFSIKTHVFRPPVGITNPHLRPILENLGLDCIGFSCRALDFGNRRIDRMTGKVLKRIRPGDILLLHDCCPHGDATPEQWLEQVEEIIQGLQNRELKAVALSDLIGKPVMKKIGVVG